MVLFSVLRKEAPHRRRLPGFHVCNGEAVAAVVVVAAVVDDDDGFA